MARGVFFLFSPFFFSYLIFYSNESMGILEDHILGRYQDLEVPRRHANTEKKNPSKRNSLQRDHHKTRSTSRLTRPRDQSSHATFIPFLFFPFFLFFPPFFFSCPFLLSVDFIYFMHRQIPPLCSTAFGAGRAWKPPLLVSFLLFSFLLPALFLRFQVLAGISLSWPAGVWKVQTHAEQAIRSGRGADASGGRTDGWMDDSEGRACACSAVEFHKAW